MPHCGIYLVRLSNIQYSGGVKMVLNSPKAINSGSLIAALILITIFSVNTSMAFEKVNKTFFGVAIKGYDTVAYHTDGRAIKGNSDFSYNWNDAKWYFESSNNRDLFSADPDRYAPQYGGY